MSDYESDASSASEVEKQVGGEVGEDKDTDKNKNKRPNPETPKEQPLPTKKARPKPEWPVISADTIHTLKEQRWTLEKIRTIFRHDKEVLMTLFHKRNIPDADVAAIIGYVIAKE